VPSALAPAVRDDTVAAAPRRPRLAALGHAARLLRPRQWVKNAFVLAPLVFAGRTGDPASVRAAAAAFVLFCLAASWGYVLNDLLDRELDARHPLKRSTRPLAAGLLTPGAALGILAGLSAAVAAGLVLRPVLALPVAAYLLTAAAYSAFLKHVPGVELLVVALCFVLRVYGGAHGIGVPLSAWMLVTTLCLAVYLAALKRRQELRVRGERARPVLRRYSARVLDRCAWAAGASSFLVYGLFTLVERPELLNTLPLVLAGLFRYFMLAGRSTGESPTDTLLSDYKLAITVLAWAWLCVRLLDG
jgi:decaprenyl-phosphate phosphoribosyltransferase